jgi:hypothetical protein
MTKTLNAWLCLAFAGILISTSQMAYGQASSSPLPDITFSTHIPGRQPPFKIVRVLIDNKPIPLDVPVSVSPGWVNRLAIEIQNVSKKDIVYGEVIVEFPETGTGNPADNKPTFTTISSLGREPATAFLRRDGTSRPVPESMLHRPEIRIPPGETMRFSFNANPNDTSEADVYRLAGAIHKVTVLPRTFFFADGSIWRGGGFAIPAPPPIVWREVSPDEF